MINIWLKTQEKKAPQGKICKVFLLNALKTTFGKENLKMDLNALKTIFGMENLKIDTIKAFFLRLGQNFPCGKDLRGFSTKCS